MKKILSVIISTLVLFLSISGIALASDGGAVIYDGINKVDYDGRTYIAFTRSYSLTAMTDDEYDFVRVSFTDEEMRNKYSDFELFQYTDFEFVLLANCFVKGVDTPYEFFYIEQSHYDEVAALADGTLNLGKYKFLSPYDMTLELTAGQLDSWTAEENRTQLDAVGRGLLINSEQCNLYTTDSSGFFGVPIASLYCLNPFNNGECELIMFDEYNSDDFYALGSFALETADTVYTYRLTDESLRAEINDFICSYPEDTIYYADDFTNFLPDSVMLVIAIALFGILPLAAILAAVATLIIKRKTVYRGALIAVAVSAVVVIACLVPVLLML